jgi:nicotinate-nucleotide pyrophosphorylase (carboxylating)
MDERLVQKVVSGALEEDIGPGDITTEATIPEGMSVRAVVKVKEDCVVCGLDVAKAVFRALDRGTGLKCLAKDGEFVKAGTEIAEIRGPARAILSGERTALNFLQRLSGIATKTRRMAEMLGDSKTRLFDTRKTTPGLRALEKYAVKCGGGENHRKGLYDGVLIKDSHIGLVGLKNAVFGAKKTGKSVEVETKSLGEVKGALEAGADIIMLDNMGMEETRKAVKLIGDKAVVEVSGGIEEGKMPELAGLGVQRVSAGSLTHSVKAIDMGMKIEKE